jgi:hypothetical protein
VPETVADHHHRRVVGVIRLDERPAQPRRDAEDLKERPGDDGAFQPLWIAVPREVRGRRLKRGRAREHAALRRDVEIVRR